MAEQSLDSPMAVDEDPFELDPVRYADMLPYEIWMECFILLDMWDLKNVSRTCHFLRGICLPLLLKSVTYSLDLNFHRSSTLPDMVSQLDEFADHDETFSRLTGDDEKRRCVHKLTLANSVRIAPRAKDKELVVKSMKDAYDMYLETFVSCAPLLFNLREVIIRFNKNLDKKLFTALAALPQPLEQLSFISVKFGAHVSKPLIRAKRILIDNSAGHDANPIRVAKRLELFSGESLEELKVLSPSYSVKLFRAFSSLSQGAALTKLAHLSFQLHEFDLSILEAFLTKCPKLTSIKADFGNRYGFRTSSTAQLPPSTVPHLHSLEGYDQEVRYFVPGRPVRKIVLVPPRKWIGPIRDDDQIRQLLDDLSKSTGPVRELDLDIEIDLELLTSVKTRFPELSRLGVKLSRHTQIFPLEDPYASSFDGALVDKVLPPASKGSATVCKPFPQIYLFTAYMNILHWIALKRLVLPTKLKSLYLEQINYFLVFPDILCGPESLNMFDDQFQRSRYSGFTAELIFRILSILYPHLKEIIIGLRKVNEIRWDKDFHGNWSCSRISYPSVDA
ncbi:hypothetical protein CVT26_014725 [Gymnopilus dilepis]|uniref:F-box domain-containing protein n=1 Tax=Gymnopilus dilepis TaxID=231916 RepID=A0A409VX45_9AGAR|nr:hypothetical protein CVT26_014725 [Gymnopilus dilepis]